MTRKQEIVQKLAELKRQQQELHDELQDLINHEAAQEPTVTHVDHQRNSRAVTAMLKAQRSGQSFFAGAAGQQAEVRSDEQAEDVPSKKRSSRAQKSASS